MGESRLESREERVRKTSVSVGMASSSCVLTQTHRVAAPGPARVISELTRGREIADRLRVMLRETETGSADSVFPAQTLVTQLLDTFTHSLTMLRDSDEVSEVPSAAKPEDSGDSCKTPPPPKDRRGCYKRKRNAETVIKESPNMVEDGHAWRKYGQKVILNAKHPRNYFRCTHKYDQGCQASKQVQRVQDNPPLYRTTYNGHHTCNANTNINTIILSSPSTPHSSQLIWSFNTPTPTPTPAANHTSIKQEIKSSSSSISSSSSRDDYYMAALDASSSLNHHHHHHLAFSSDISSDVYSCSATATTHDHDHDHLNTNNIDIDDDDISIEDFLQF